jgi:hypothetical protein
MDFTSCSHNTHRSEDSFCERPSGTFQKITGSPLVCTKLPGTIRGFAMWSKGQRCGAAGEIPGTSPAALAGEVAREGL